MYHHHRACVGVVNSFIVRSCSNRKLEKLYPDLKFISHFARNTSAELRIKSNSILSNSIVSNFRICTILIEAAAPLDRTLRIKMYKNNARSNLFCRIPKVLLKTLFLTSGTLLFSQVPYLCPQDADVTNHFMSFCRSFHNENNTRVIDQWHSNIVKS